MRRLILFRSELFARLRYNKGDLNARKPIYYILSRAACE